MLFATVWEQRQNPWLWLSYGAIVGCLLTMLLVCWIWRRQGNVPFDVSRRMRQFITIRVILSSAWATGLVTLTSVADPAEQILVFGASIGIISTTVFGGPAPFAVTGWGPVTIGAFAALFVTHDPFSVARLICLIAYSALTFFAILAFDRQTRERSANIMRTEQHAETISILLRDFEESSSDWLWETDASLTLRHVSARFAEVARREPREMEVNLIRLIAGAAAGAAPTPLDRAVATLRQRAEARTSFRELVVPVRIGAERRWWALTGKPLFGSEGDFIGYRGVGSDVTAVHRSRERIAYLARHDTLTDLANRSGFNEAIAAAVAESARQRTALLCLDLDEFKAINDSYGHDVGDSVLRGVAQRIRGVLREHDLAARLGGDEFAILVALRTKDEASAVAARILDCLGPPFACGDLLIKIGVSIGIAIAPDDGDDADVLYRNADLALYRAKSAGRGTWRVFDANMDRHLQERRLLQRDLREALPNGELFVAYQPIVDLRSRELIGLEALVRWRHPERGIVPPAEFVPIAEQSGLIGSIGTFVLSESAELARQLPSRLRIAVNLSPLQLRDEMLLTRVRDVLDRFALSPERIEFEITESVMLETSGRSLETLRGLRVRGHCIAIDDFGTGYSSLAALRGFPFDRLKIDRSFIADLASDGGDGPIVKAVIGLGRALGISVTAEGVESERQARVLSEFRCSSGQGYYFSRPLSPAQVLALVAGPAEGGASAITLPTAQPIRVEDVQPREAALDRRRVERLPRARVAGSS